MNRTSILSAVVALFIFASTSFAQKPDKPFQKGIWLAQGSVGFVSGGLYGDVKVPPINFVLEHAIDNEWAVGFFGGYGSSREEGINWGFEYSYAILAGSASYHFEVDMKNLDPYGRVFAGYVIVSASVFGSNTSVSAKGSFAGYGGYVGATYYLSPQFGVQGEVGYGNIAIVRFGVTLKF
jgi:hypothetical protein